MKILKTVKLFIGGEFPRSESGRTYSFSNTKGEEMARVCQSSRKDFRNAIEKAKAAEKTWSTRTAFNRSQILYRMAEMLECKRLEFVGMFTEALGYSEKEAQVTVSEGIDAFVYYAGFCDKFQQISGSVNNINGPFHNFTTPDSVGVVAYVAADEFNFGKLCADIASILVGGNSIVALLGEKCPIVLAPLAEVFATSDLPKGVVNLLTGHLEEIYETMGSHREVRAINYQNENRDILTSLKTNGADNMKRIVYKPTETLGLEAILNHVEFKSVWHPIGV